MLWPVISDQILHFFKKFDSSASIPQGANSSFIVLIHKKSNPKSSHDFRPISLINFSFKLVLKVLVNRLKLVLNNVISEDQSAFLKGRNITESIFMVNETIHGMRTHNVEGIILKLDFSKAYDSIDWSRLYQIIECINLEDKWLRWIRQIFETMRMSILINGSPTDEFLPKRGVRQGDPLASYLFLLVGEVLSKLLNVAQKNNLIAGIKLPFHPVAITHFQYADDTILFIENKDHIIRNVKTMLLFSNRHRFVCQLQ